MKNNLNLYQTSQYLMTLDPDAEYTDEELDRQDMLASDLIQQYGWPAVCQEWKQFLYEHCHTEGAIVRFAHNFFDYVGGRSVPDALHLIAYLYYKVDVTQNDDAYQIFDSLAIAILSQMGLVDMAANPWYTAETDPRIQAEIIAWTNADLNKGSIISNEGDSHP